LQKKRIYLLIILVFILTLSSQLAMALSVEISQERAEKLLLDLLHKRIFPGDLNGDGEPDFGEAIPNPLVEIVGYTNLPTLDNNYTVYYVKSGDSLYKIARNTGTTVDKIKMINNLYSNYLYVGQKIYIPVTQPETRFIYQVKPGDTLFKIARNFETTIEKIRELNRLNTDYLYIGQKIYIPLSNPRTYVTYFVQPGDSLYKIAQQYKTTINEIKRANNLISNSITVGQKLNIPIASANENQDNRYRLKITEEEMELLARAVYSEARGEPFEGQVAIAAVIINRVLHPIFPDTISGVIFQPWQFTAVHDGQFWLHPNEQAYTAARAALEGWDPTNGAIYYYNPDTATSRWVFYRTVIVKIGNHYFAV
jgi:N-acetylmuramoyl-L-alanine amidase